MNESLIKYLAGLLDADGSLSFTFRRYDTKEDVCFLGLTLSLASSDKIDRHGFVSSLPELTGMGGIYRYGKEKQYISWKISKRSHLEMILPRLIKHMVVKARHWQILLDVWQKVRGKWLDTEMRNKITEASKNSRIDNVGPIKPKNHPTWAWLAGYLDGDGWYLQKYQKPPQNYCMMLVGAVAHENDVSVLEFIKSAFGGYIRNHTQQPHLKVWKRNLGVRDKSFALRFLPKLVKHSRLKKHKIEQMIHFHQQRLSVSNPAG